jgi:hypothetical protein
MGLGTKSCFCIDSGAEVDYISGSSEQKLDPSESNSNLQTRGNSNRHHEGELPALKAGESVRGFFMFRAGSLPV